MKTQIKNIGIIATISIALFLTGTQVFAYNIDGYVQQVEQEIEQGMKTFQNDTNQQISDENKYKLDLVKRAMEGAK